MKNTYPALYYSDYLELDKILSAQNPKSKEYTGKLAHDEVLFIIIHQTYELWFKQILHELNTVAAIFEEDYVHERNIGVALARVRRVLEIFKVLNSQMNIIETMTPMDFLDFRDYLSPASGFQSFQFRLVENKLGLKAEHRNSFDKSAYYSRLNPEHQKLVLETEKHPSLLELVERWLERTPFLEFGNNFNFWESYQATVNKIQESDRLTIENNPTLSENEKKAELAEFENTMKSFASLFDEKKHQELAQKGLRKISLKATRAGLLINLYRDEPILHLPFEFLTALIDLDELMTNWRYAHSMMVNRMIGSKIGTGGSSGHHYLRGTADNHKVFSDFTNLATFLVPRSQLPELPQDVKQNLGFYYKKDNK